jgi:hypothetical protein
MVAGFARTGLSKSVMLVAVRRTRMTRREFTALLCCALILVGAQTYLPGCALAKESDRGGSDRGDGGGRGDSGGGGNSEGGRGNSGGGGNSEGGRGNSDGGRGNSGNDGNSGGGGRGNSGNDGNSGRGGGGGRGEGSQGGQGGSGGSQGAGRGEGSLGGESRGGSPGGSAAGGRSNSGARGASTQGGWGTTSPERAREAVSQGWALPLGSVLPTVTTTVPGQVLEVDLRQTWTGDWIYDFLVLTQDRRYREVVVDARTKQVLQVRKR